MKHGRAWIRIKQIFLLILLLGQFPTTHAQNISPSPSEPWTNEKRQAQFDRSLQANHTAAYTTDPNHVYTLPELINLAELHNPDTRVAWQNAKIKLAAAGIAASALYPSVAAVAIVSTWRNGPLIGTEFHRQTIGLFQPTLNLNYLWRRSSVPTGCRSSRHAGFYKAGLDGRVVSLALGLMGQESSTVHQLSHVYGTCVC